MAKPVDLTRPGPWAALFESALTLTDHLATVLDEPVCPSAAAPFSCGGSSTATEGLITEYVDWALGR